MDHLFKDLGYLSAGSSVVVTLSNQANVQLMDKRNYASYKAGRKYTFYGGKAVRSPVRLTVPRADHWVVAIDLGGYAGRLTANVRVD